MKAIMTIRLHSGKEFYIEILEETAKEFEKTARFSKNPDEFIIISKDNKKYYIRQGSIELFEIEVK